MSKMTKDELKQFISSEIGLGLQHIDSTISERRERILRFINLDMSKDLPARRGGSKVVDGTMGGHLGLIMPSLMRIMFSGPLIGEYVPNGLNDEKAAKEATEYVNNVVLRSDNDIELIGFNWGYDGISQIVGMIKIYWKEDIQTSEECFENLTEAELAQLQQKFGADQRYEVTDFEITQRAIQVETPQPDGTTALIEQTVPAFKVTVKKTVNRSRVIIENLPPEEFCISRDARSLEDAVFKSHRTSKTIGALEEEGYDTKVLEQLPTDDDLSRNRFRIDRGENFPDSGRDTSADPKMREVAVHQGIVRCNYDGKGVKDWYVVVAGDENITEVLEIEEYDCQIIFADFCPIPIPHTFFGRCPGDDLIEPVKVRTSVIRSTLDNLNLANVPQTYVQTSTITKGTLEAMTQKVPGGIVPLLGDPNATVRETATPFFAQHSFAMLDYFERESEKRTGVSMQSMALDPDALQNQSATAANIMQSASMGKIELIARLWAAGGMRKMFRGILKLEKRYRDFGRETRIGKTVKRIDPREWADFEEWDCTINTGLGTGSKERDLQTLILVANIQKETLAAAGPSNGIVTPGQYANTIKRIVEVAGLQNAEQYVMDVPIDVVPPVQPPQPSPDTVVNAEALKQIEAGKAQARLLETQAKIESDERQALAKLQSDKEVKLYELQLNAILEANKLGIDTARVMLEAASVHVDANKAANDIEQAKKQAMNATA